MFNSVTVCQKSVTTEAVSYTHLDVYKRQEHILWKRFNFVSYYQLVVHYFNTVTYTYEHIQLHNDLLKKEIQIKN